MLRKDMIELLRNSSMDLVEIARHLEVPQKEVEDDIRHLMKSLKHADDRLVVTPAYCRKCEFEFNKVWIERFCSRNLEVAKLM